MQQKDRRQRTAGQFFEEAAERVEDESERIAPDYHLEKAFLASKQHLGPPSVLDVSNRSIPFEDVSQLVAQRHGAVQEPAVFTVSPAHAELELGMLPSCQRRAPVLSGDCYIVRMERGQYAVAVEVSPSETVILHPRLIDEINGAVRQSAPDHARDRVDDEPEPILRPLDFVKSPFQCRSRPVLLGNVHHRSDALDAGRFIAQGMGHGMDTLDGTIRHQQSMLDGKVLSILRRALYF